MFLDLVRRPPWIDYPAELRQKGFVGVCFADDAACRANLKALNPNAEPLELTVHRRMYGIIHPAHEASFGEPAARP